MLTLALALSLSITSNHSASLLDDGPRPFSSATLIAQADQPPPVPGGYAPQPGETLQSLRAEYERLERSKPKLGGWIAMMAVGTPLCALFTFLTVTQLVYGTGGIYLGAALIVFTGVIAGIAFAAAVIGTIFMIVMAVRGGRISTEMEEVRQRIDVMERSAPPAPPPGYYPPPPPPPPPAVERPTHRPLITVATF